MRVCRSFEKSFWRFLSSAGDLRYEYESGCGNSKGRGRVWQTYRSLHNGGS